MIERRRHQRFRIFYIDMRTLWARLFKGSPKAPPRVAPVPPAPALPGSVPEGPERLRDLGRRQS
jgi:hypothetical protein